MFLNSLPLSHKRSVLVHSVYSFKFQLFVAEIKLMNAAAQLQATGVCYGRVADDLPSDEQVVSLYQSNSITRMRIYDPNEPTLQALRGSDIELMLGVPNGDLQALSDPSAADAWVQENILAFTPDVIFRYISVGNEISPSDEAAPFVLPAMLSIYRSLAAANLQGKIKVSTSIQGSLLGSSYPPSAGSFADDAKGYILPIVQFLKKTRAPLLLNVYPYFAYISDTENIRLDYALFTAPGDVVQDGSFGYENLFDAMLDAHYSALEKAGALDLEIVVSESGWPSDGGVAATVENASAYYGNLINHVNRGTPRRPGKAIETYLFAMFDEDQKGPAETERHFGLFTPSMQSKYGFH